MTHSCMSEVIRFKASIDLRQVLAALLPDQIRLLQLSFNCDATELGVAKIVDKEWNFSVQL